MMVAKHSRRCSTHLCARKLNATISKSHGPVIHRTIIAINRE
jgi:hypothetical protein